MEIEFEGILWIWQGDAPAAWYFITLPQEYYADLKSCGSPRAKRSFGSLRVTVTIGQSTWKTSIFPSNEKGSYLLPIKKEVRKAVGLENGGSALVHLTVLDD